MRPTPVPTLRLADYTIGTATARARFAHGFRDALQEFGFAVIRDPGLPAGSIAAVYDAFTRFFALDAARKGRWGGIAGGARGYTAYGVEHAHDNQHPDLKEFFHVGPETPRTANDPPNVWPTEVPELVVPCRRLFAALATCSGELLEALAVAYALPPATFSELVVDGNHVLRALHYPPVRTDSNPASLRAAPHEDINLITLLCEATDSGLEIRRRAPDDSTGKREHWLAVEAPPGHLVVNAGDMLARLTNDVIPATTHRVANPPDSANRSRYSLPFFAHPRPECDLSVMPAFVSADRPAKTAPIRAGEFLEQRLREIGLA